jgi:hypothetical protein
MGYGEDIYKLALLSSRQREDIIEKLNALPGHKSKLNDFFRIIDQVITIYFYIYAVFSFILRVRSQRHLK